MFKILFLLTFLFLSSASFAKPKKDLNENALKEILFEHRGCEGGDEKEDEEEQEEEE